MHTRSDTRQSAPHAVIDEEGNEVAFLVGKHEYVQLMRLLAGQPRLSAYWREAVLDCVEVEAHCPLADNCAAAPQERVVSECVASQG